MTRDRTLVQTILYLHQQLARAADPLEMSMSQYHLLHFLHEGPRRAADFTVVSKLRKPGITSIVSILEGRGWIVRETDPTDGRAQIIRITEAGYQAFVDFEDAMHEALEGFLGPDLVEQANREMHGFHSAWNERRVDRFDKWRRRRAV